MPTQDTSSIKEKIISFIKTKGPSLPVHIAKEVDLSILFTSAFLSELLSEKKIKTSDMKIGSSSLYLIQGQEPILERFSQHLKSKEKEAFLLLKEKKFLKDLEQEPAIRVALRAIKDFAIPFQKDNKLIWRYFIIPENDFREIKEEIPFQTTENIHIPETKKEPEKDLNILEEIKEEKSAKKTINKKVSKKKSPKKTNEKFFNRIKEFLAKKQIEILDIEGFSKTDLILRVNINQEEKLLVAYNKKSIREEDILKANKKAQELHLKYIILSFGEPQKKVNNFIEAIQNLSKIEKIEE